MNMNNYGTKIKIKLQYKWTGLTVSGHAQFQLCQFKIEGYHITNFILRSVVKRLIWMILFYFYTATDYIKFTNARIRIFTNTRRELNKESTRWCTKCHTIDCTHNTFLLLQKHLTSGTELILIGWKIVPNEILLIVCLQGAHLVPNCARKCLSVATTLFVSA